MKERPILFNGDMVRAILAGRKTQTRRPVKFRIPYCEQSITHKALKSVFPAQVSGFVFWDHEKDYSEFTKQMYDYGMECPYGVVGDRLWVRETWRLLIGRCSGKIDPIFQSPKNVIYGADMQSLHTGYWDSSADEFRSNNEKWRPSIHMPRWASRITLEITGVRVERVQDISGEDCYAEGVVSEYEEFLAYEDAPATSMEKLATYQIKLKYSELWDAIYSKRGYSWESNPWVWVIEFRRVKEQK